MASVSHGWSPEMEQGGMGARLEPHRAEVLAPERRSADAGESFVKAFAIKGTFMNL